MVQEQVQPLSDLKIESYNSVENQLDEALLEKISDAKSRIIPFQKSTYDSVNQFYIDDSRYSHLSIGGYESFSFKIIDARDTLYAKHLILASKIDPTGKLFYESYLAKSPIIGDHAYFKEGDLVSNNVILSKITTDFVINKSIETISTANCIYVYETTTTYPSCRQSHLDAIESGQPDPNPRCDWSGTATRTMVSHSCSSSGGFGGNFSGSGSGIPDYDPSANSGGNGFMNPDGETPFGVEDITSDPESQARIRDKQRENEVASNFYDKLTPIESSWLDRSDRYEFRSRVFQYLFAHKYDLDFEKTEKFAIDAVKAKMENEDTVVDFDEQIINQLTGKSLTIYNKMNQNSDRFKNAIKKFEPEFPVSHIKFDLGDLGNSRGRTIAPNNNPNTENSPNYVITVRLNNNGTENGVNRRPELLIVKTIAHEVVHAQLYRIRNSENNVRYNLTAEQYNTYLDYIEYRVGRSSSFGTQNAQHDFMANYFVLPIAAGVRRYDSFRHSIENYKFFGWDGLEVFGRPFNLITPEQFDEFRELADIPLNDNFATSCD